MNDARLFVALPAPNDMQQDLVNAGRWLEQQLREGTQHRRENLPHPRAGSPTTKGRLRIRLIPPENIHLTLFFLGDTPTAEIPLVEQQLAQVAGQLPPPRFRAGAGGVFPARGAPRVAWCGVEDIDGSLCHTAEAVADALGRTLERFRPHFTLGYLKGLDHLGLVRPAVTAACAEALRGPPQASSQPSPQAPTHTREQRFHTAKEMVLFESKLHPSGAEHVALRRYAFAGA
ncbi:MAG: hypothetical protein EA428_10815 [Spirochaetaceae bacterium]|nr:MAG: hypothetical protein EA428_10815 [Spirochaetaceae bacterium]